MPYLNQAASPIAVTKSAENEVRLKMPAAELAVFRESLAGVIGADAAGELRVDYPEKFTLFWKQRDGETRMLLAHPEVDTWVGTVAWSRDHAPVLLDSLAKLAEGELRLSSLAPVSGTNNLEVVLEVS